MCAHAHTRNCQIHMRARRVAAAGRVCGCAAGRVTARGTCGCGFYVMDECGRYMSVESVADRETRNTIATALVLGAAVFAIGGFVAFPAEWGLVPFGAAIGCSTAAVLITAGMRAAAVTVFVLAVALFVVSTYYAIGVVADPAAHTEAERRAVERAAGMEPGELDEIAADLDGESHRTSCVSVMVAGVPVGGSCPP